MKRVEGIKNMQDSIKIITRVLPQIRRFLETKTIAGKTKYLNEDIRQYISDKADYVQNADNTSLLQYFGSILFTVGDTICVFLKLDKIPLFNPENILKLALNTIIVAYNCFFIFLISVEVCFSAHFGSTQKTFHSIAMAAWVLEMFLQMNSATYYNNSFTKDRKIILKIYVKEYFFFEILPLLFEGRSSTSIPLNIILHLPLLLKIKGIMIIMKKLEFYILQILEKHYILILFKLCAKVIILCHIIACTRNIIT